MTGLSSLLVVGGNSGIGREVANLACKEGWDSVDAVGMEDCDITRQDSVDSWVEHNGPWSHVVYSAGVAHLSWIRGIRDEEVIDTFDVNAFGFVRLLSALTRNQVGGRVVAIVSDASETPMRGSIAYCSSKAALRMMVRVAARELAPDWSINGISPCAVTGTPMTAYIDQMVPPFRGWTSEQAAEYERMGIPMGRRARVDEVADLVIATLRLPSFMTGSIINLTGGK